MCANGTWPQKAPVCTGIYGGVVLATYLNDQITAFFAEFAIERMLKIGQ